MASCRAAIWVVLPEPSSPEKLTRIGLPKFSSRRHGDYLVAAVVACGGVLGVARLSP